VKDQFPFNLVFPGEKVFMIIRKFRSEFFLKWYFFQKMAALSSDILRILETGDFSALEITRKLKPTYTKKQIQHALHQQLQSKVMIKERVGQRPIWTLREPRPTPPLKSRPAEEIVTKETGHLRTKSSPDEKKTILHFRTNSSPSSSPGRSVGEYLIGLDLDSCSEMEILPIVNKFSRERPKATIRGYYTFGKILKEEPQFEVTRVTNGTVLARLQHWLSRETVNTERKKIILLSHNSEILNFLPLFQEEGFQVHLCDTKESLLEALK
jgi:hypothetical protein